MKLIEALELVRQDLPDGASPFRASLVCSFTPGHLQTFLHAHLRHQLPTRSIAVTPGLYGDFWGTLARVENGSPDAAILLLEWSDLDPRLGLRSLGLWTPTALDDILINAKARLRELAETLQRLAAAGIPAAVSFPTLPLPPVSFTPTWRAGSFDLALRPELADAVLRVGQLRNIGVVNPQRLEQLSPLAHRFDIKSELASGFPYKLPHASTLASLVARLVQPPPPKKGLITDLDDTLWSGILGEVGADGLSWDLEHHSFMHAAYQKMLHALSEAGVLLGVASKNDAALANVALSRSDMILPRKVVFPVEAHWGPKSESVGKILKAWNIGADAVVFIDDSPMELAEVQAAYPQVTCLPFPKDDPHAIAELLSTLRDLFGKSFLSEEDAIRRDSILQAQSFVEETAGHGQVSEEFLKAAEAEITLSFAKEPLDPRALELLNKTNQFNLNGRRYTEKEWLQLLHDPAAILLIVSYKDKYGPLGKIAVLAGRLAGRVLRVEAWVMSCRAFSRRIEHRCLEELFERFQLEEIVCDFTPTAKNGPTREFLADILGYEPASPCHLSRELFATNRRTTFHQILELTNG
jgi:FkbH-like protein